MRHDNNEKISKIIKVRPICFAGHGVLIDILKSASPNL